MWAARHGHLSMVETLLANGLNLLQEQLEMRSLIAAVQQVNEELQVAVRNSDLDGVKAAIEAGADVNLGQQSVNVEDADGWTPLMWAALHQSLDMVQLVIRHGANPNLVDERGEVVPPGKWPSLCVCCQRTVRYAGVWSVTEDLTDLKNVSIIYHNPPLQLKGFGTAECACALNKDLQDISEDDSWVKATWVCDKSWSWAGQMWIYEYGLLNVRPELGDDEILRLESPSSVHAELKQRRVGVDYTYTREIKDSYSFSVTGRSDQPRNTSIRPDDSWKQFPAFGHERVGSLGMPINDSTFPWEEELRGYFATISRREKNVHQYLKLGWVPKFFVLVAGIGGLLSSFKSGWAMVFVKKNTDHEVVKIYNARTLQGGWLLARLRGKPKKKKKKPSQEEDPHHVPATIFGDPESQDFTENVLVPAVKQPKDTGKPKKKKKRPREKEDLHHTPADIFGDPESHEDIENAHVPAAKQPKDSE
eukprot:Skav201242  [mRNA]  locus=scaffold3106:34371:40212:- [translate_table: standard]